MSVLTEKQQLFAQGIAQGLQKKQAALVAGYAPGSAQVTAAQLLQRADIKAAIKAAKKSSKTDAIKAVQAAADAAGVDLDESAPILKDKYDTPGDLMEDAMNNPRVPFGVRIQLAKDLLPYFHAKVGETGKKQSKKDAAAAIANGEVGGDGSNVTSIYRKRQPPKAHRA